ncbi:hypothetical protein PUN28_015416 [Cardiocondyla obscurior]|uniref:Uncharacterized protein n=1 Tax=Cardiocondyla obscurior TaxID=286306 RepID=A0AAW2ESZ0_9HYME
MSENDCYSGRCRRCELSKCGYTRNSKKIRNDWSVPLAIDRSEHIRRNSNRQKERERERSIDRINQYYPTRVDLILLNKVNALDQNPRFRWEIKIPRHPATIVFISTDNEPYRAESYSQHAFLNCNRRRSWSSRGSRKGHDR